MMELMQRSYCSDVHSPTPNKRHQQTDDLHDSPEHKRKHLAQDADVAIERGNTPSTQYSAMVDVTQDSSSPGDRPFTPSGTTKARLLSDYNLGDDINNQLKAGVFRFSKESEFYSELKAIIQASAGQWLKVGDRKDVLEKMLNEALDAVKTSGPKEFDLFFVWALYQVVKDNDDDTGYLQRSLDKLLFAYRQLHPRDPLPRDMADIFYQRFLDQSSGLEETIAKLLDFLREHVFGYPIQANEKFHYTMKKWKEEGLTGARATFVEVLINILGKEFHAAKINAALGTEEFDLVLN